MSSYRIAIEKVSDMESNFYKEQNSIPCDKKYAIFKKNKIDKEVFNSEIADKLFENIWIKNNYDLINSQEIANKLFEISSSLSVVIAKRILENVIKQINPKLNINKDIIFQLNKLCKEGLEKNILCLLRSKQKEYYLNMISQRPEESNYLAFLLRKTYL